jgi:hypothetical protein
MLERELTFAAGQLPLLLPAVLELVVPAPAPRHFLSWLTRLPLLESRTSPTRLMRAATALVASAIATSSMIKTVAPPRIKTFATGMS